LFIAAAIPGPGITAIVARALGSGFRETFFMGLGLVLGDMTYLTAVILGLAFVAQSFTEIFIVIKFAGVIYLGYIAWKLWTSGLLPQEIAARKSSSIGMSFLSGLLVTLGNPKTMLFYVALVPTLIDIGSITVRDYGLLLATTSVVLLIVLVPYMLLASRARILLKKPKALQTLNRVAAGILAGTAAFIATRAA
jgi:threonine/homoserine/homoserine lactone efflux protein